MSRVTILGAGDMGTAMLSPLAHGQHEVSVGATSHDADVLSALRRAGRPYELSPGQLVAETLVTSGTMTNRVDRLAESGFVERHPDPADRRGVLVRLTSAGRAVVDAAMADLIEREHAILAPLDDSQRDELAALLRQLLVSFESGRV